MPTPRHWYEPFHTQPYPVPYPIVSYRILPYPTVSRPRRDPPRLRQPLRRLPPPSPLHPPPSPPPPPPSPQGSVLSVLSYAQGSATTPEGAPGGTLNLEGRLLPLNRGLLRAMQALILPALLEPEGCQIYIMASYPTHLP